MKKEQGLYRFKREDKDNYIRGNEDNYILRAIFGDEKTEGAYDFCQVTICKVSLDKEFEYMLTRKRPVCHLTIKEGDFLSVRGCSFELKKEEND